MHCTVIKGKDWTICMMLLYLNHLFLQNVRSEMLRQLVHKDVNMQFEMAKRERRRCL